MTKTMYTVTKGLTTDLEFEAYERLLGQWGLDISNLVRVPEQGTQNRWLHAWEEREEAERFARTLRDQTGDRSWNVHCFQTDRVSMGPIAPLDIFIARQGDGCTYRLHPLSRKRILDHDPESRLVPKVFVGYGAQEEFERLHGPIWDQIATLLTGLSEEQVRWLGGFRIYDPLEGRTIYTSLTERTVNA